MQSTLNYHFMVKKLRQFFQEKKGFIEVPAQSRVSILAACEQPQTITPYTIGGMTYPLPQTGQMWLEHEMLKNPQWPGVYCVTTSYRDEPNPIEGRHQRIFPMFEFESTGDFTDLKNLEKELVTFLGFKAPTSVSYQSICQKYNVDVIEAEHETQLAYEYGSCISLEKFPNYTNPFWNMKSEDGYTYSKIDVLLHGMETIGSAERETDREKMRDRFHHIEKGEYAALLFQRFGRERVMAELENYLALPMVKRFGGGIGLTRLERAMRLEGLLPQEMSSR